MSERQVVICELGDEHYGIDIGSVYEIIRSQAITAVPAAPGFVEGVINLRGLIIPIVDLASRFGMARAEATRASRIVVAGTSGMRVGLIVDGVSEVLMVQDESVEPTPAVAAGYDSSYISGIAKLGEQLVILLDLNSLFGAGTELAVAA